MKVGDIVTVAPACSSLYLIVGLQPDHENNIPCVLDGIPLGMLWELYDPQDREVKVMYNKWVRDARHFSDGASMHV
tara:strand:- start:4927 stop:5154 length:228 start_codon:yes stop_codon:yes gene_type:complete